MLICINVSPPGPVTTGACVGVLQAEANVSIPRQIHLVIRSGYNQPEVCQFPDTSRFYRKLSRSGLSGRGIESLPALPQGGTRRTKRGRLIAGHSHSSGKAEYMLISVGLMNPEHHGVSRRRWSRSHPPHLQSRHRPKFVECLLCRQTDP